MQINRNAVNPRKTHEGVTAHPITSIQALRRSVLSCLLWEDSFYEDGESIADRIKGLIPKVSTTEVSMLAVEARSVMNLRHVPLLLAREMARDKHHRAAVGSLLPQIIQRADELSEFLSIYWKDGKTPVAKQVKKGLAEAFKKFDEYHLAKYNRDREVKLRDVLFVCHAKPKDATQADLWKRLVENKLTVPDTWEVGLSKGEDKGAVFTRLMAEKKLGAMALLRNLRNMNEANVDVGLIRSYMSEMNYGRVLPFRFISAAKHAQHLEPELETAMFKSINGMKKLPGKTMVIVDCSGSMQANVSMKSQVTGEDAACAIAMMIRELSDDVRVFAYGTTWEEIPPRRGFALRDAIHRANVGYATNLGATIRGITAQDNNYDRIVCVTDEQTRDTIPTPDGRGYVINVMPYQNGVGYGKWIHIDGWSDAVVKWMAEYEEQFGVA